MSFQDLCRDLEAGLPPRPSPPPGAVVAHCVFQINTKVSELRRLAHELAAGAGDARVVRQRIRTARADVKRLARNTTRRLADPATAAAVGPNLATEFQAALREFQWVQGRIIDASLQETAAAARRAPPMFRPPSSSSSPIGSSSQLNNANANGNANVTAGAADHQQCNIQMMQQQLMVESRRTQELVLLDNEITFNEALVEEREREISKIQQEIAEINEMFVDLGKLVHGQQGAIDVVQSNTEKAAKETREAEEEHLTRAARTHETNSSIKCLLITVLGLVMLIFALVSVAKSNC